MATLGQAKRLVIKIGSALLVDRSTGTLRENWLASLADDIAQFRAKGVDVVIVLSCLFKFKGGGRYRDSHFHRRRQSHIRKSARERTRPQPW